MRLIERQTGRATTRRRALPGGALLALAAIAWLAAGTGAAVGLAAGVGTGVSAGVSARTGGVAMDDARAGLGTSPRTDLYPEVLRYLERRRAELGRIPSERRQQLDAIADYVRQQAGRGQRVRLNFVCTHNSRRSHMAQLWAQAAADLHALPVATYSGGTEDTAFNPRAVAAVERAGMRVQRTTDGRNPVYHVRIAEGRPAMTCFSKAYASPPNPRSGFAAVMVCADADEACPIVDGADARFAIPYQDPKAADDTPAEAATYDERCAQIAREMLYVFERAAG